MIGVFTEEPAEWCVIIFRNMPVTEHRLDEPDRAVIHEYPVAVFGPLTRREANLRAQRMNCCCADEDGPYRPVANAPAWLGQENWDERWAMAVRMNDVEWG